MPMKDLEKHLTICQWRMIRCYHCDQQHPACQLSKHYLECKRFPVDCPKGCGKKIPRGEIQKHLSSCPEEMVKCTFNNCKETMARKYLEDHVTTTCQWRMLACEYCGMQHPVCQQSEHQQECKRFPVSCPDNCGKVFPREEIEAHTNGDCDMAIVPCPFADMGCTKKVRRCAITQHIQSASVDHLGLACFKLNKMDEEQKKLIQTTEKLEKKLNECLKENDKLQDSKRTLEAKTRKLEENLNYALDGQNQFKRKLEENLNYARDGQDQLKRKLEQDISAIKSQLNTNVNRSATVDMIEDHLNRAKDDVRRELDTMKSALRREIDTLRRKITEVENNLLRKIDNSVARQDNIRHDVDKIIISRQGANRQLISPQFPVVPMGMPCTPMMYGGYVGGYWPFGPGC